jgi:hypothetical protein
VISRICAREPREEQLMAASARATTLPYIDALPRSPRVGKKLRPVGLVVRAWYTAPLVSGRAKSRLRNHAPVERTDPVPVLHGSSAEVGLKPERNGDDRDRDPGGTSADAAHPDALRRGQT